MKIHLSFCLLVCCTCTIDMAMSAVAQNPIQKGNSSRLLVVNQGDATLSIVDPTAAKQIATVAEGESDMVAHEVAASPDGRLAYLPLYGNSGLGSPGTDGRLMLVIDIATRRVVGRLDFGHGVRPHSVIFDRSHKLLYVTTELDQTVTVID